MYGGCAAMQSKLRPSTAEYKSPCTADTLLAPFSAALNSANRVERSVMSLAQACCAVREKTKKLARALGQRRVNNIREGLLRFAIGVGPSVGHNEKISHRIKRYRAEASLTVSRILLDQPQRVHGRPGGSRKLGLRLGNGYKFT